MVMRWVVDSLVEHAWKLIVLVSGHGTASQLYHLQCLAADLNACGNACVVVAYGLAEEIGDDAGLTRGIDIDGERYRSPTPGACLR